MRFVGVEVMHEVAIHFADPAGRLGRAVDFRPEYTFAGGRSGFDAAVFLGGS